MPYEYVTSFNPKKLQKMQDPEATAAVLQEIETLAGQTVPVKGDQVNQWLGLLAQSEIMAQKWKGSVDLIEVYPSGKKNEDRIMMSVSNGVVNIQDVGISRH
ncbi:hypothetical protein [Lysobacter sp. Root690]|uniref:hypothetical protein n=1 Tax=Lysobacter sp. Root690 TaxID=1736588 RepID=UPI0006F2DB70|nr:hypothetical protein [Lysobacter sp. Root690]KRB08705.1 hypothetical protein ASD86_05135 [Lysobacter sp. Root690]